MESTKPMKQPQLSMLTEQSEDTCEMTSQQLYDSLLADDAATGQLKSSQLHELLNATPTDPTTEIDLPQHLVESTRPQMETVKLDLALIIEEDLRSRTIEPAPTTVHPTCQIDVNQIIEAMPIALEETHDEQDAFLAMMGMRHPISPNVSNAPQQAPQTSLATKNTSSPERLRKKNTLHVAPPNLALPPIIAPTTPKQAAVKPVKLYIMMGAAAFMFVSLFTLMLKLIVFT